MAKSTLTMKVRVAWWLKWYLRGVALTCQLTGMDFDEAKVRRYIRRAVTVKVDLNP